MPYYYGASANFTSNATPNTFTDHIRTATGTANPAWISMVEGGANFTTLGGLIIRGGRYSTASTVGSAMTAVKSDPNNPAATLTINSAPTAGTTFNQRITIGLPATGGAGIWAALNDNQAIKLLSGGGTNGNFDFGSFSSVASVTFDLTVEWREE